MEAHTKTISLVVGVTKRTADIAVNLSIPYNGVAACCLKKLMGNCSGHNEMMPGSEHSALAFALFEQIRDKLTGSALEVLKSRVSNIKCHAIGNHIVITWNCQGTGSSLRKTCGLALSCLNVSKLFSKYSENIKFLSGKAGKREDFDYCVKALGENIKKHVYISAVGKITITKEKLDDIIAVLEKKVPSIDVPSNVQAPAKHEHKDAGFPEVVCSGIAAAAAADYIRSNSGGMGVQVTNTGVTIFNNSWESKHKQLKDPKRIKDYVQKKYEKLGSEFPVLFSYFATTQGYAHAETIKKILRTDVSVISDMIKTALK